MALMVGMFGVLLAFAGAARADYAVNACGSYPNDVFTLSRPADGSVTTTNFYCPAGGFLPEVNSNGVVAGAAGDRGGWQANAPAGLEIVAASVPNGSLSAIIDGGWSGGPYWRGGSATVTTNTQGGTWSGFASPFFGFELACASSCAAPGNAVVDVMAMSLNVRETVGPSFTAPGGLWQANGWVRGAWPLDFSGDSPSGVCALSGTLNGIAFNGTSAAPATTATWHQCSAPAVSTTINTASYGQGLVSLVLVGRDAAGNVGSVSKTVNVDNSVPSLSLSGPTDAPSTAGTQFVTATAGGSPSGIDQIVCSVDGGPAQPYPGAVAHVPVSGLGEHQVSCTAYNNAVDPNGVHGVSQTQGSVDQDRDADRAGRHIRSPRRLAEARALCEACRTVRPRKQTFIVRERATGRTLQLGSSCLRPLTGSESAEEAIRLAQTVATVRAVLVGAARQLPAPGEQYTDTTAFLAHVVSVVRSHGFHRSGEENAIWRTVLPA